MLGFALGMSISCVCLLFPCVGYPKQTQFLIEYVIHAMWLCSYFAIFMMIYVLYLYIYKHIPICVCVFITSKVTKERNTEIRIHLSM